MGARGSPAHPAAALAAALARETVLSAAGAFEEPPDAGSLRERAMRGGGLLLLRQAAGLLVTFGGVLVLTRKIGPAAYGVYAAAFGIVFFAQTMGELSLDVYIVRYPGELTARVCDRVFTLLALLAALTTAITITLAPLIGLVLHLHDFVAVAIVLFASIPAMHLQQVPLSRLERALDYASIGMVEVLGQVSFFVAALPIAFAHGGVWAPVAGWWTQQLVLLAGFWLRDDYRPRLAWDLAEAREILTYGVAATTSNFAYSLRNLVNPLLVGGTLGAAAVGYVALALRLVEQLGFARQVLSRLSITVLARLVEERERLRRALTQGTLLQLLVVGVPLTGFSLLSAVLVPFVFGHRWDAVATLVPLLAPAYLATAAFNMHNSLMMTRARPWDLVISQGANAALLWAAAAILVPTQGVDGYAYAELTATLSWILTDRLMARRFPRPRYGVAISWWAALSAAALAPVVSWWLLFALPVGFLTPPSIRELRGVSHFILRRGSPSADVAA